MSTGTGNPSTSFAPMNYTEFSYVAATPTSTAAILGAAVGKRTKLKSLHLVNPTSGSVDFTIYKVSDGGAVAVDNSIHMQTVSTKSSVHIDMNEFALNDGDSIFALASASGTSIAANFQKEK